MEYERKSAVITDVRPYERGEYIALFSVLLPSGIEIHGCSLKYMSDGRRITVAPPMIPQMKDKDLLRDGAGRPLMQHMLSFQTKEIRQHFEKTCLDALRRDWPELFVRRRR